MNMSFLLILKTSLELLLAIWIRNCSCSHHWESNTFGLDFWAPLSEPSDKIVTKWECNSRSRYWQYRVSGSVLSAPHTFSHSVLGCYLCCLNSSTAKLTQQNKQTCIIWKNEGIFPEWYIIWKITYYIICILQNNSQKAVEVSSSSSTKKTITEWFKEKPCDGNCNQSLIKTLPIVVKNPKRKWWRCQQLHEAIYHENNYYARMQSSILIP